MYCFLLLTFFVIHILNLFLFETSNNLWIRPQPYWKANLCLFFYNFTKYLQCDGYYIPTTYLFFIFDQTKPSKSFIANTNSIRPYVLICYLFIVMYSYEVFLNTTHRCLRQPSRLLLSIIHFETCSIICSCPQHTGPSQLIFLPIIVATMPHSSNIFITSLLIFSNV